MNVYLVGGESRLCTHTIILNDGYGWLYSIVAIKVMLSTGGHWVGWWL